MHSFNPSNPYRQIAAQTAPPGKLVLMLFDGALRFLASALSGFESDDPAVRNEAIHNNILKTQAIVNELNVSLDMNAGGELATHLRRLYQYLDARLWESNIKKDPTGLEEAVERLSVLRDSWDCMLRGVTPENGLPAETASVQVSVS